MFERRSFLNSHDGFSFIGTLVAIAIGGLIAVLVATLIREAARGQRSLADRDEMSEFVLFVKNMLSSDASCTAALSGKPFRNGGREDLELEIGYLADKTAKTETKAKVKKGFTFAEDSLVIEELSIEDRTPKATTFNISMTDGNGRDKDIKVERHLARIKLQLANASGGDPYRPRYFEIPVLVNADSGTIEMCNNQINIGDACQALGFRWDTSTIPPTCQAASTCLFGGAYTSTSSGGCVANPSTGSCNCPEGYTPVLAGSVNIQRLICAKGCDNFQYDSVFQCFRCPR